MSPGDAQQTLVLTAAQRINRFLAVSDALEERPPANRAERRARERLSRKLARQSGK